jgi:dipeptidyl aminopeptidase/acylaminoacyl peptidase
MTRRSRQALFWIPAFVVGLYLSAMTFAFVRQRAMIYPAPQAPTRSVLLPGFSEAVLHTSDDLNLKALYRPPARNLPTLVFFHGNGDSFEGALAATSALASAGYGLLLPEYRGYAGNPGSPSETGLYRDGEAALQWLADRKVTRDRIVIIGNSLGSGVATEMAARHAVAGLVLISGFARFSDIAATRFPFFPVRLLLLDRYENAAKLPRVTAPVLILHGAADTLVPLSQGRALVDAARSGSLVVFPHAGHELAYLPESQAAIAKWLESG